MIMNVLSVTPTLFAVQDFAWIDLHLCLAVRLIPAQPAVAGEHVVFAVVGNHDLNAVQEPACAHALVGVADHKTVDLPGERTKVCVKGWGLFRFLKQIGLKYAPHLSLTSRIG